MKMKLAFSVLSLLLCGVKATPFEYVTDETGFDLEQVEEEPTNEIVEASQSSTIQEIM